MTTIKVAPGILDINNLPQSVLERYDNVFVNNDNMFIHCNNEEAALAAVAGIIGDANTSQLRCFCDAEYIHVVRMQVENVNTVAPSVVLGAAPAPGPRIKYSFPETVFPRTELVPASALRWVESIRGVGGGGVSVWFRSAESAEQFMQAVAGIIRSKGFEDGDWRITPVVGGEPNHFAFEEIDFDAADDIDDDDNEYADQIQILHDDIDNDMHERAQLAPATADGVVFINGNARVQVKLCRDIIMAIGINIVVGANHVISASASGDGDGSMLVTCSSDSGMMELCQSISNQIVSNAYMFVRPIPILTKSRPVSPWAGDVVEFIPGQTVPMLPTLQNVAARVDAAAQVPPVLPDPPVPPAPAHLTPAPAPEPYIVPDSVHPHELFFFGPRASNTDTILNDIRRVELELMKLYRKRDAEVAVDGSKPADFDHQVARVMRMDGVDFARNCQDAFIVVTKPIQPVVNGVKRNVGALAIHIPWTVFKQPTTEITVMNCTHVIAGVQAPHARSNGRVCWGAAATSMVEAMSRRQLDVLVSIILAFFNNPNIGDPLGNKFNNYPEVV